MHIKGRSGAQALCYTAYLCGRLPTYQAIGSQVWMSVVVKMSFLVFCGCSRCVHDVLAAQDIVAVIVVAPCLANNAYQSLC